MRLSHLPAGEQVLDLSLDLGLCAIELLLSFLEGDCSRTTNLCDGLKEKGRAGDERMFLMI
jgi:hypothetical protein